MFTRESLTDPRRIGLIASLFCGLWLGRLFVGDLGAAGDWAIVVIGLVGLLLMPLPPWEEKPDRRWLAALGMVALALVVAVAASLLHR